MNEKKRYFRVQYGHDKGDFLSITEEELPRAIYAKLNGTMFKYANGTGMKDGKTFLSFDPDYHKHTGWARDHKPTKSEDFREIHMYCPDYTGSVDRALAIAKEAIKTGNILLLEQKQLEIPA